MKKTFKFYISLWGAKIVAGMLKILRKNASFLPGKVAITMCKNFLGIIEKPEIIIGVTGTNGKTTVCNMIIDALEKCGYTTINNRLGSNVDAGIASSLINGATFLGKTKKQVAVLEIDERSSIKIYPYVKPTYIVCTNIFRDSIKRNAHTDFIIDIINSAIPKESKLILNADDLICCSIGPENKEKVYFGIDKLETDVEETNNIIRDIRTCPICDTKLKYEYMRYHHIGKAYCPKCSFKSPEADYLGTNIDYKNSTIQIKTKNNITEYKLISDNIINIYNMVAVIAVLTEFGIEAQKLKEIFDEFKIVETRYSEEEVNGKKIIMHLAKGQNAIACSRTFDYIKNAEGKKAVMLNLDDYFDAKESTEDIAWIYDTDYELLNDDSIEQIIVGGVRSKDHYLRLLIAGVPEQKISYELKEIDAVDHLNIKKVDKIFILYDVYTVEMANKVKTKIEEKIKQS